MPTDGMLTQILLLLSYNQCGATYLYLIFKNILNTEYLNMHAVIHYFIPH